MNWSEHIKYTLKKALRNQSEDFGGVQAVDIEERNAPFYILYKKWPKEKLLDGKERIVIIFFDKDDFEKNKIMNSNEDNREGGSYMPISESENNVNEAILQTYSYIERNFRGYDEIEFEPIEEGLLQDFAEDESINNALKARLNFVNDEEKPGQKVSQFIKAVNDASSKGVVSFTKKMIKEFGLKDPIKFKFYYNDKDYWTCCFFFEEGFNFIWEKDAYGSFSFEIERNNPNTIKAGKCDIGLKKWTMGSSPRYFDIKNYNRYRDFAERIIDRAMGRWQVSLDMEE